MKRVTPRRRAMAAVYFAIVGIALAGLFAFVLDSAHYYYSFHQLQAAADASSLAALDDLPMDLSIAANMSVAQQHAADVAMKNICDGTGVVLNATSNNSAANDIYYGRYNFVSDTFTVTTTPPINAVHVAAYRTDTRNGAVKFIFPWANVMAPKGSGGAKTSSNQIASATAVLWAPQPGLLLLSPNATDALNMKGQNNEVLNVKNGSIIVDSTAKESVSVQGTLEGDSLALMKGSTAGTQGNKTSLPASQLSMTQAVDDPIGPLGLDIPSTDPNYLAYGGNQSASYTNSTPTLGGGYYYDGLPSANHVTYTLKPGVYILDPKGPSKSWGSGAYLGSGVVLYLLPPSVGVNPSFPNSLTITAPSTGASTRNGGAFANIAIYEQRTGASPPPNETILTLNGNPTYNISGAIYMPYIILDANGNFDAFGNEVILSRLILQGSTTMTIDSKDLFPTIGRQRTIINTARTTFN